MTLEQCVLRNGGDLPYGTLHVFHTFLKEIVLELNLDQGMRFLSLSCMCCLGGLGGIVC